MTAKTYKQPTCPGIRRVTRFQTADGQTFPTEEAAFMHADPMLWRLFELFLTRILPDSDTATILNAVEVIQGSRQTTRAELTQILGQLNFGEN